MTNLRVLSMGWGRQTWTLAAMMALGELPRVDFIVHADTTHEMAGTYEFRRKWEPWLGEHGLTVATVQGKRPDVVRPDVVRPDYADQVMIPAFTLGRADAKEGQAQRQCTNDWKIQPIRRFIRAELDRRGVTLAKGVVESWQGISFDESYRARDSDVDYITNVYPLLERRLKVADCIAWLRANGLDIPPKSACTFCPFHSLAHWRQIKRRGGADWREAIAVDGAIREKRREHITFVHPRRKPLARAVVIPEDFGASQSTLFGEENACDSGYCMT